MRLPGLGVTASSFLVVLISVSGVLADTTTKSPPQPGTLNYVEGQVSIGTQKLNSKSVGSAELRQGQSLTTENGKAEVLLTPGVFLRVGPNSSVKMISPSLSDTEVNLEKGHAMVEVAELHKENDIRIAAGGATARLLKTGLYDVDLNQSQLRVFDGKAYVQEGDEHTTAKGGREVRLDANRTRALKATKFKKKSYEEGNLYRWSSLRSSYLAEANVDAAALYAENGAGPWGSGWWGADWYWDPYFDTYTFIPGDGIFYSPFGWGFYSPWWVSQAPFYGYGGYGYGYSPYYRHFGPDYRNWGPGWHYAGSPTYAHGIYQGAGSMGGFRSGPRMMMGNGGSFGRFGGGGLGGGSFGRGGFGGGGFHGGGFHGGVGFHGGGGFHGR